MEDADAMPRRPRPFRLATGEVAQDCRRKTSSVSSEIARRTLKKIRGGPDYIKTSVDFSKIPGGHDVLGLPDVVPLHPRSRDFLARRVGKNSDSRFVRQPNATPSPLVTVVLERRGPRTYGLGSAYYGPPSPPEPDDHRALQREAKRRSAITGDPQTRSLELAKQESRVYWNTHAFRLGSDSLVCGQCLTTEIPKEETVSSLYFSQVLCKECAGQ